MNKKELERVLRELSRAPGVAGSEEEAVAAASRFLAGYTDRVERDRFGNLLAYKKGRGGEGSPALLLAAHIDEIGLIVSRVDEGGFLRFTPVGGVDPRVLPGQAVEVHGRSLLKGVVGARPPHLLTAEERSRELKIDDLYIDLGLPEEKARETVRVGDYVSLDREPLSLGGGQCLAGKAMDNRAGVAALICCAADLAGVDHTADIYLAATMQEEVGLRGAITAAFGLVPDLAVAVDVTHGEAPGIPSGQAFDLGAGPAVAVGPNVHPALAARLRQLAREHRLPYQLEPIPGSSSTDAWAIQITRAGIPCAVLSIPLRYMHSSVELLNLEDLKLAGELLALFARSVDRPFVEGLRCI